MQNTEKTQPLKILIDRSTRPEKFPFGTLCRTEVADSNGVSCGDYVITKTEELDVLQEVVEVSKSRVKLSDGEWYHSDFRKVTSASYRGTPIVLDRPSPKSRWWDKFAIRRFAPK